MAYKQSPFTYPGKSPFKKPSPLKGEGEVYENREAINSAIKNFPWRAEGVTSKQFNYYDDEGNVTSITAHKPGHTGMTEAQKAEVAKNKAEYEARNK